MSPSASVDIPDTFTALHRDEHGTWVAGLPSLIGDCMDRWAVRPDGPSAHGMGSLVVPVVRDDGLRAVLKFQPVTDENAGAPAALRRWNGDGIVHLLDLDEPTGTMLLERLDAARPLSALRDDDARLRVVTGLLARLVAVPAPPGMRRLGDIAAAMVDDTGRALPALADPGERALLRVCAGAVAELVPEPGDRLLHWDLHRDNVLAGQREPWIAIDPVPLAGDPGFELLPALGDPWDDGAGTVRGVLRRFDLMTEALGLDRPRAAGWTLGRVLQNALWDIEDGKSTMDPEQVGIARTLLLYRR
ncbi:aminoglycoside phosphotransferase family protein [Amycolatopsis suaedae]|uniref:Hydroxyurea phosphotransferase n=1 Tax=Amycolatopsis suaedae TaxID=2510978 RepID=A0A4Q7JG99_9PSEU|nr:aminoglycoside phosphotransferase family protein [Amycolatopsis suaedae]RZQ65774.1 hydroxyurea phosphotransferase [Amycolatopsis suaedae]